MGHTTHMYPSTQGSIKPCPLCGSKPNALAVFEAGIEHRFSMPVLPASDYGQALCPGCGLLYINAPLSDAFLVELYSQETVAWQKEYVGEGAAWNGGTNEEELRRFASVADIAASYRKLDGVSWLDFGCQTGELGHLCQRRYGVAMFGVDVSADYAQKAEALWKERGRVRNELASFVEEGKRFDVVSALETLEHLASPWETVRQFAKAIAPGGLLVVTVPSAQYFRLKYRVFSAIRRIFSRQRVAERAGSTGRSIFGLCHTHPYNFSPRSLRMLLEQGGFNVVHVSGIGWSKRFAVVEFAARVIAFLTGNAVQIFPSIVAVATAPANVTGDQVT